VKRVKPVTGRPAVIVSVEKQPNVDTIALTRQISRR
jgi:hypothetical protein